MEERSKFIGIVEDVFQITGRGVILCLKLKSEKNTYLTGTKIKLVKPNNETLETKICGITFNRLQDVSIEKKFQKEDVHTNWI